MLIKSQIEWYGLQESQIKLDCRTWLKLQPVFKGMEFKLLNIEKPNHYDWVVLVESDISFLFPILNASHQTMIGKTVITSIGCQDDMVQDLDIKKYCGLLYLFGQLFVLLTSLQLAGRMVM